MNKETYFWKKSLPLIIVLIIYLVSGFALLPFYRYQINPDGISYISIAQKYLRGDFAHAINGHFSPLFSWLLIPLLYLGLDPLIATKILNLALGVVTIVAMRSLSYRFQMHEQIRETIFFTLIPVVLYFAYYLITPDLLVSCILLFYFTLIFHPNYADRPRHGMLCGMLAGLAYLSKSYSLPFLLFHFPFMSILHYFAPAKNRKVVLFSFFCGMFLFLFISGIWIAAISNKYGYFTISTQTKGNLQFINPHGPPSSPPFIEPPDETAVSVWEDPFSCIPMGTWSPFESFSAFQHWLKFFVRNIPPTVKIFIRFSPFSFLIGIAYLLFLLCSPKQVMAQREVIYPLVTVVPYAAGYCLILIDERYIWITCLLLIMMGGYVLQTLFQNNFFTPIRKNSLLFLFILSFAISPVRNLARQFNSGKDIYLLSEKMKEYIPPRAKLASSTDWYQLMFLAYHLRARIYGTGDNINADILDREMDKYGINYFIVYKGATAEYPFLVKYKEVTSGSCRGEPYTLYMRQERIPR
jgi:hypothetical protein